MPGLAKPNVTAFAYRNDYTWQIYNCPPDMDGNNLRRILREEPGDEKGSRSNSWQNGLRLLVFRLIRVLFEIDHQCCAGFGDRIIQVFAAIAIDPFIDRFD